MCVLGLCLLASPDVPFVAAHSRDEYFERPVGALTLEGDGLVLSRDLTGGGTWAGLNSATGVYASVTNVRDASPRPAPGATSRGLLVVDVLRGRALVPRDLAAACDASPTGAAVVAAPGTHAGFNLVVAALRPGGGADAFFVTNRGAGGDDAHVVVRRVPEGAHCVSNSPMLDDPAWGKVCWVREQLARVSGEWGRGVGAGAPARSPAVVRSGGCEVCSAAPRDVDAVLVPLLAAVATIMMATAPVAPGAAAADPSWSPLPPAVERHLQTHVHLQPMAPDFKYGTRALTIVAQLATGDVAFASTTFDPPAAPAATTQDAAPTALAGVGGPRSIVAGGRDWHVVVVARAPPG